MTTVRQTAEVTVNDLSDAYSVTLTNEAASFKATSDTKLGTAATATTKPQAFRGTEAVSCSVSQSSCVCSDSTNVSVSVNSTGDNATWPLLTITIGANANSSGTVTIPVVIGSGGDAITINKVFSYSIALKGTTGSAGKGISSATVTYQKGTSATTAPTGTWQSTPPATSVGEYLWTKTVISYTSGDPTTMYSVAAHGATGSQGETGATGRGVSSTEVKYQVGTSATTAPTGTWQSSPQATTAGQYLWTRTVTNYTSGDPTTSYSVAAHGATGTDGGRWYSGTAITGTSTTPTVFSGSGITSAVVGDMYMNTSTYNTYRCTLAGNASTAKWAYVNNVKGAQGDPGADGVSMSITSNNGTTFRNNSGSTTLTAHVWQSGAEVTGSALTAMGTIQWYKDGTAISGATGATLTVSASDVSVKAVYTAKLEG